MDESGEDTGGLRRELWRLLKNAVAEEYCHGGEHQLMFMQNVPALQVPIH